MKTMNIILISVTVLILLGIIWLVAKSNKQAKIKDAAIKSGLSNAAATAISQSANPAAAAESVGVSRIAANAIALGVAVIGNGTEIKASGNCPCDNTVNGVCIRENGLLSCRTGTVLVPTETAIIGRPKSAAQLCNEAGGDWVDVWNPNLGTKGGFEKGCVTRVEPTANTVS